MVVNTGDGNYVHFSNNITRICSYKFKEKFQGILKLFYLKAYFCVFVYSTHFTQVA